MRNWSATVGLLALCCSAGHAFVPSIGGLPFKSSVSGVTAAGSSPFQLRMAKAPEGTDVNVATTSRRDFGKILTGFAVAGGLPFFASNAMAEDISCRAKANKGAEMGGTVCKGIEDVEFKRAFVTTGTATKITGDAKKLETFYSQINAGYVTLQDLEKRWDQYTASGDGDVIRRRLGTVGNKSPLHNIRKVFEGAVRVALTSTAISEDDFEQLDELLNSIIEGIAEVDTNLYSTAFVGTQEVAGQLRGKGKAALLKVLDRYQKFLAILEPVYAAEKKA